MSQLRVPVTDAFDTDDSLQSIEAKLTKDQVDWLRANAKERGLSVDHMLRSIITAHIRDESEEASATAEAKEDLSAAAQNNTTRDAQEDSDPPSIVESLRSASERLQDLTEQDEAAKTPNAHNTSARLKAFLETPSEAKDDSSSENNPGTVLLDNQSRSMFDLMEGE